MDGWVDGWVGGWMDDGRSDLQRPSATLRWEFKAPNWLTRKGSGELPKATGSQGSQRFNSPDHQFRTVLKVVQSHLQRYFHHLPQKMQQAYGKGNK